MISAKTIIFAFFLAISAVFCEAQSASVLCDQGRQLYTEKKYAESRQALEACLKWDPKFAEAYHLLGMIDWQENKFEDAIVQHKKAAKLDPKNPEHIYLVGVTYSLLGKAKQALKYFKKSIAIDSNYFYAWLEGGKLLTNEKNFPLAMNWLNKAISSDGMDPRAWEYRAAVNLQLNSLYAAEADIETAIKLSGNKFSDAGVWMQRGWINLARENNLGAVNSFSRAVELFPQEQNAILWLARTRSILGDSNAFDLFAEIPCNQLPPMALLFIAETKVRWEKWGEGSELLNSLGRENNRDVWVPYLLSQIQRGLNNQKLAEKYYWKAFKMAKKQKIAMWLQYEIGLFQHKYIW